MPTESPLYPSYPLPVRREDIPLTSSLALTAYSMLHAPTEAEADRLGVRDMFIRQFDRNGGKIDA